MKNKINTLKKKALLLALQSEILERFQQDDDNHRASVGIESEHKDSEEYYLTVHFKTSGNLCGIIKITTNTNLTEVEVSNEIDDILSEITEHQKTCSYCGLEIDGDFCSNDCLEADLNDQRITAMKRCRLIRLNFQI